MLWILRLLFGLSAKLLVDFLDRFFDWVRHSMIKHNPLQQESALHPHLRLECHLFLLVRLLASLVLNCVNDVKSQQEIAEF